MCSSLATVELSEFAATKEECNSSRQLANLSGWPALPNIGSSDLFQALDGLVNFLVNITGNITSTIPLSPAEFMISIGPLFKMATASQLVVEPVLVPFSELIPVLLGAADLM